MRAVIKARPGPGAELASIDEPTVGAGQALLRVVANGICGTDLHILDWNPWAAGRVRPPQVMGHEMAGVVVQVGPGVLSPRVGELVGVETHIVDLSCPQCRSHDYHVCQGTQILGVDLDGTWAEMVVVPARNCRPAPSFLDPAVVCFMEPMGNAVHACQQGELKDKVVVVAGCGPIGCAAVGIARAEGASRIVAVDRVQARLGIAEAMGAHHLVDSSQVSDLPSALRSACGGAADVILEMSGHPSLIAAALEVVRPGGWISLLGLGDQDVTIDLSTQVVMKGVDLYGVTGRRQFQDWDQTADYLRSGRVDPGPILTHRLPLAEFDRAANLCRSGEVGKVVLYPLEVPSQLAGSAVASGTLRSADRVEANGGD